MGCNESKPSVCVTPQQEGPSESGVPESHYRLQINQLSIILEEKSEISSKQPTPFRRNISKDTDD